MTEEQVITAIENLQSDCEHQFVDRRDFMILGKEVTWENMPKHCLVCGKREVTPELEEDIGKSLR